MKKWLDTLLKLEISSAMNVGGGALGNSHHAFHPPPRFDRVKRLYVARSECDRHTNRWASDVERVKSSTRRHILPSISTFLRLPYLKFHRVRHDSFAAVRDFCCVMTPTCVCPPTSTKTTTMSFPDWVIHWLTIVCVAKMDAHCPVMDVGWGFISVADNGILGIFRGSAPECLLLYPVMKHETPSPDFQMTSARFHLSDLLSNLGRVFSVPYILYVCMYVWFFSRVILHFSHRLWYFFFRVMFWIVSTER